MIRNVCRNTAVATANENVAEPQTQTAIEIPNECMDDFINAIEIGYGYSAMLGFRVNNGKLEIVPEEAEIVKRIFNSYVYKGKGCHTIANELNAGGLFTVRGKMWREDGVCRIL